MKDARKTHNIRNPRSQCARPTIGWFGGQDVNALDLWLGAVDAAQEHDANLIWFAAEALHSPVEFQAQANMLYELVSTENVDGLMSWTSSVASHLGSEETQQFFEHYRPLPIVCFGVAVEGISSVLLDNYQGMHDAVVHLIKVHGYRRIIFIRGPEGHPEAEERYRAYLDALAEYDIPFDANLIVPGTFEMEWASSMVAKGISFVLDERKADVEAIVAATDVMACAAEETLQVRGIRIPNDVAVVGFDDIPKARSLTPPLTTVRQPLYEMGRKATETLLAQIEGQHVPERVLVPARLVVRQSCGCADPIVVQAAAGVIRASRKKSETSLNAQREGILVEMIQAVVSYSGRTIFEEASKWAGQLLDAFATEMEQSSQGTFLSALNEVLRQIITTGDDVVAWQNAISVMRRKVLCFLDGEEALLRVEDLWQQARLIIGQTAQRIKEFQAFQQEERVQTLGEIGARLITTFDVEKLMDVLVEQLPRLGISSCYLSLYENPQPYKYPQSAPEWSRLILAYTEYGRVELEAGEQCFLSRDLVPKGILPQKRSYSIVLEPLYFQEEQLGYVLFEVGPRENSVYEALRVEISSALQGDLLLQRIQERSAELARQKYILDTFMANVPDSIYFKDRESCITQANLAHARLFGFSDPAEEVGKSDFDFFPENQARPKYEQEQEIMRTGQPVLALEEPDGPRWALTTKMPLRDEHGEIIGTFGISRDITELKQAQQELAVSYEEIRILNEQLKEENVRMSAELNVARKLQEMILPPPEELQQIEGLEIVGYMQPADEVGGDYYDVLKENGIIHIGIGDVTGHGLKSGVLMLMTQTAIRTLIEHGETNPVAFVNTLNRTIYKNVQRMGVDKTLTFALVNYQDGQLKIVGQHEELLVVRQGGQVERVDTMELGFPIGLVDTIDEWVAAATVMLQPGDGVVLYTDGITEAENMQKKLYGLERLCEVVSQHWDKSAEEIKQAVVEDVVHHIGQQKVYDDLTLVVLKKQ